jgi:hypothetical protein
LLWHHTSEWLASFHRASCQKKQDEWGNRKNVIIKWDPIAWDPNGIALDPHCRNLHSMSSDDRKIAAPWIMGQSEVITGVSYRSLPIVTKKAAPLARKTSFWLRLIQARSRISKRFLNIKLFFATKWFGMERDFPILSQ